MVFLPIVTVRDYLPLFANPHSRLSGLFSPLPKSTDNRGLMYCVPHCLRLFRQYRVYFEKLSADSCPAIILSF